MAQILAALGAAHRLDIVHRDLKPANIVVTYPRPDTPFVKVLDFGIATGVIDPRGEEGLMGTPVYMAPEQALGKEVDARADVYAAGVILYEILAERRSHRRSQVRRTRYSAASCRVSGSRSRT